MGSTNRITWWAVGQHTLIGVFACLLAGGAIGPVGAYVAWPIVLLSFPAREVITAAARHHVGYLEAAEICWAGEDGFSPWNLRLQAFAPAIGALPVVIFAGWLFQ